jgi:hypothetical protein
MMDRIVAAAAGMAAAFYVMASAVAWFRVAFPMPSPSLAKRVMLDRAVAWSALSAIFSVVVTVKLGLASWYDDRVGLILALASISIFVAGLVSVRAITAAAFGHRVLAVFAVVSIAVGLLILLI